MGGVPSAAGVTLCHTMHRGTPLSEDAIPATGGKSTAQKPMVPGGLPALLTVTSPQGSPGVDSQPLVVKSARKSAGRDDDGASHAVQ